MIATLQLVALDCPDLDQLAAFYSALTGWPVVPSDDDGDDGDWAELRSDAGPTIAFQRVDAYRPPEWPEGGHPQQLHLDFTVGDLDTGETQVLAIGARKVAVQPQPDSWRVFLDPAGHPFCLVLDRTMS